MYTGEQDDIRESEIEPFCKQMLQLWQVCGLDFPDVRALPGGGGRNRICRELRQSSTELNTGMWFIRMTLRLCTRAF